LEAEEVPNTSTGGTPQAVKKNLILGTCYLKVDSVPRMEDAWVWRNHRKSSSVACSSSDANPTPCSSSDANESVGMYWKTSSQRVPSGSCRRCTLTHKTHCTKTHRYGKTKTYERQTCDSPDMIPLGQTLGLERFGMQRLVFKGKSFDTGSKVRHSRINESFRQQ
jgi:hypothetical protein